MKLLIGILLFIIGFGIALTAVTMIQEYRFNKHGDFFAIIMAIIYACMVFFASGICIFL
jgi:divalent metal cation (Fe/Co/Zn/Cd) transporter